jgi:hypothetical protein
MKKGMRKRVSGDDVCDCCFGEQLDNRKPFRPLNIFKHMIRLVVVVPIAKTPIISSSIVPIIQI